jgi:adenylate kinase
MLIALTGTPGTGKTTVAALLPYPVIDLNAMVKEDGYNLGWDSERGCLEADMDRLEKRLSEMETEDIKDLTILEGHFSHYFADETIVLRLAPSQLKERLLTRGYSDLKIQENLEAEAIDVVLTEAVEFCSRVDEIDTTGKSPSQVADIIVKVLNREIEQKPGQVDWLEDYLDLK